MFRSFDLTYAQLMQARRELADKDFAKERSKHGTNEGTTHRGGGERDHRRLQGTGDASE
jgi:hypothetical protein